MSGHRESGPRAGGLAAFGFGALRAIPPAAVALRPRAVVAAVAGADDDAARRFGRRLCADAGLPHAALFGDGRSGLAALLAALAREAGPDADEVLVPAYTCWSVASAAARAGLKLRLADVDPETLDLALDDFRPSPRLAAAIGGHLFGRSLDVARLAAALRSGGRGVPLIEDAAQTWPAPRSGADYVLLSFARGKLFPLGGGGAVLGGELAPAIDAPARGGGWRRAALLLAEIALGRPPFFGALQRVPFLGVGATVFDPQFAPRRRFHHWQGRLALRELERLPTLRRARGDVARALRPYVEAAPGWRVPRLREEDGWLRFPALAPNRAARDRALASMRRNGVWASPMYPACLADIPGVQPWLAAELAPPTGARALADRLLTLPVSPGFSPRAVAFVGEAFRRAAKEA